MARLAPPPATLESWARRRRRARQLLDRYAFAAQMLGLYTALLDAQERAFLATLDDRPDPARVPHYVGTRVMGEVADAAVAAGPPALAAAIPALLAEGIGADAVTAWQAGERQEPMREFLARAAASPVLEALGPAAGAACRRASAEIACPRCGGLPQVSYLDEAGEALVSVPRRLQCSRCSESWVHQRMTCVGCGEQTTARLPIFADPERFPHLRADACESCRRYVITVDLRKDPEAVPVVDELTALPLDLHAQEHGFAKITSNLMAIG